MRTSYKLSLLLLGLPVCLVLAAGVSFVGERGAEVLAARKVFIDPMLFGWMLAIAFVAIYAGWVWLVLRRWKPRGTGRAFEVLPPK